MSSRKRPIAVLKFSDLHMGSPTGIMAPQGFETAEGNTILPSPVQRWLWDEVWLPGLAWAAKVVEDTGATLYGLCNGDATDTHVLARILTREPEEQSYIIQAAFGPLLALPFKKFFIIRGTPSHVGGETAGGEESMGRILKREGLPVHRWGHQWSTWEMEMEIHGTKIQVAHHGRGGSKQHTMQSNASGWAVDIANTYREQGLTPPALIVRAHTHSMADSGSSLTNPTRYLVLPPMQIKNAHAHKVSAHRPVHLCKLGMVLGIYYPEGGYTLRAFTRSPDALNPMVAVA